MGKSKCAYAGCGRLVLNKYCYWHDENNKDRKYKPTKSESKQNI